MTGWASLLLSSCRCGVNGRASQKLSALCAVAAHTQVCGHRFPGARFLSSSGDGALPSVSSSSNSSRGDMSEPFLHPLTSRRIADASDAGANTTCGSDSSALLSSIASSRDLSSSIDPLADLSSIGPLAAQPLEPLWHLMNPVVISCSVWETMHSMTGLPWWASIPLTTLALRTALLPLTLKAKSAGLNFILAQQAGQTATNLIDHWKQQQQQQPPTQQSPNSKSSSPAGGTQANPKLAVGLGSAEVLKRPTWLRLSRLYYRYYRKEYGTTSLWWWTANVAVQVNVFLAMSLALRQMAATQWPGFTDQGIWWFTDLTHPAVVWGQQHWFSNPYAPYGLAGYALPFVAAYMFRTIAQSSPVAQRSPAFSLLMDVCLVPYLIVAVKLPQATLLYWLSNTAFFMGLQHALAQPRIATLLGMPTVTLAPPQGAKDARERAELEALQAQKLVCGSEDDGFLRYLAASYLSRGMHQQALQCLQRLTVLAPGDADAFCALGTTAAELQQWPQSARAFERAAELHAVAVEREKQVECLLLAAKQWLNATAEARAMQRRERQQLQSKGLTQAKAQAVQQASSSPASSSSSEDRFSVTAQPGKQQEYVKAALAVLQEAVHFQADGAADAFYLLSMAQAADKKWEPAFEAATTFWSRSLALAENDQTARINAAAKLLPVLTNMCKQASKQKDFNALLTVAQLAVEVAKCGWDRQTEEQLRDTLLAAARAATQEDKHIITQQIMELEQQLLCGVASSRRG